MSLVVSDHALLRWLERRYGLNPDVFRQEIVEKIEREGLCTHDGWRFIVRDTIVKTVVAEKLPHHRGVIATGMCR